MVNVNEESEVIKLLLNFEKEASIVVDDALEKSDKKILEAKTAANAEFQKKYDEIVKNLESEYEKKVLELKHRHEEIIKEYKSSLETRTQNKQAFFSFVDSVLFKADRNK